MAKQIPLTHGKVVLVDDADFEHLNQWKWGARKDIRGKWYAVREEGTWPLTRKIHYMHRQIMNAPDGVEIDHRDGDGLNNQRYNLRYATHAQNAQNRGKQANNVSGYKGVSKYRKGWKAQLRINGRHVLNKTFSSPEEAARAYDEAAIKHHGEFAYLNFSKKE